MNNTNDELINRLLLTADTKVLLGIGGFAKSLFENIRWCESYSAERLIMDRVESGIEEVSDTFIPLEPLPDNRRRGDMIAVAKNVTKVLPVLESKIKNTGFVLVVAGLGGGVGSGAAPRVIQFIKSLGIPVLALVTMPDEQRDGKRRILTAKLSLEEIQQSADMCTILNRRTLKEDNRKQCFNQDPDEICEKLQVFIDVLFDPGIVSIDLSSLKSIMSNDQDFAVIVTTGEGKDRGSIAAEKIITHPIIQSYLGKSASIVVHILAGDDLTLFELDEAASLICEKWSGEVDLTYGASIDPEMKQKLRLGVIVGFAQERQKTFDVVTAPKIISHEELINGASYQIAASGN